MGSIGMYSSSVMISELWDIECAIFGFFFGGSEVGSGGSVGREGEGGRGEREGRERGG